VATELGKLITSRRLYKDIQGRKHVLVEGWTLLGSMLGVFPDTEWTRQIEGGWEARVVAKTLNGQVVGAAEAMCTHSENTWRNRDEYALRSMAQTRAVSKALRLPLGFVMQLAGYEATPAEEMPTDDGGAAASTQRRPVVTTGLAGPPNHNAASSSSVPPPAPKARATNPIVIKREAPANVIEGSAVEVEPTPVAEVTARPRAVRDKAVAFAEELARASLRVSGRSENVIKKAQADLDRAAQATFKRNFGALYDDEVQTLVDRLEVALKQKGRDLPEPN
jgi:hypothetical protein